ncbi:MAG: hypothetical protein AAGB02_08190 [Pseudomonadota bacterium]
MAEKDNDLLSDEALRKLIRETISAAGPIDPAALPHKIREQIKNRTTGKIDVEQYIDEVLRETKKN